MGANAATRLLRMIDNLQRILAIELMNAAQALEFRQPVKTSPKLQPVVAAFRERVKAFDEDRVMYTEIERSVEFLQQTQSPLA